MLPACKWAEPDCTLHDWLQCPAASASLLVFLETTKVLSYGGAGNIRRKKLCLEVWGGSAPPPACTLCDHNTHTVQRPELCILTTEYHWCLKHRKVRRALLDKTEVHLE